MVWHEIELIFFIETFMMLYFLFRGEKKKQQYWYHTSDLAFAEQVCMEPRTFQLLMLPCYQGVHRELERDAAKTADSVWSNGFPIPHGIMLSNKSCGKEWRSQWWCLSSQETVNVLISPAFLRVAEHLPADGKKHVNSLLCLCM